MSRNSPAPQYGAHQSRQLTQAAASIPAGRNTKNPNAAQQQSLARAAIQNAQQNMTPDQIAAYNALISLQGTFGGPSKLFLEQPAHNNRLLLALRSGIPDEVDFALERFLHITLLSTGLVLLDNFQGLPTALLDVMDQGNQGWTTRPSWAAAMPSWQQQGMQTRRRAVEAATVLRNIALDQRNVPNLMQHQKRLLQVSQKVLQHGTADPSQASTSKDLVEMQICLLETIEAISPEIKLQQPYSIISLLSAHTFSPDRALVLGAFRVLAGFATNTSNTEHNSPAFSMRADSASPNCITRAIELLPLQDIEITTAVLDLLYSYTQTPSSAATVCERPDLLYLLRLLLSKVSIGGSREDFEVEPPTDRLARLVKEQKSRELGASTATPNSAVFKLLGTMLSQDELDGLLVLREPKRTVTWMRWTYENVPDAEVTQVSLWTTYKEQFEKIDSQDNKMLAAADVIKHSTDAYETALPMITEVDGKKFIIRGIQPRDRQELAELLKKKWMAAIPGVQPDSEVTPVDLYSIPPASLTVPPALATTSQILVATLSILINTGIPPPSLATFREAEAAARSASTGEKPFAFRYAQWNVQTDAQNQMVGPAFLAMLVLRNIARAIKASLPAKGREIDRLGPSIFSALAGDNSKETSTPQTGDVVPIENADRAKGALLSLEGELLELAVGAKQLSEHVGEVLAVCDELRNAGL